MGFKAPSGAGIKIDSPFVSGGGFLFLDSKKGQYAGFLQLTIRNTITVTAIGVLTTKLPDGSKGFSFVVMITAQGFKPIQLGLGFTLTGIGGLLAIDRTCNEEFLREGLKNKTLDDLLFPKDPIRNAVQIFGTLNTAFPPQPGSYLFGPVLQISWFTPPKITMNLGRDPGGRQPDTDADSRPCHVDHADREARPAAAADELPRRHRLRSGLTLARRGALRFAPRRKVPDHRQHGDAAELGLGAAVRALHRRLPPGVQAAGELPGAGTAGHHVQQHEELSASR